MAFSVELHGLVIPKFRINYFITKSQLMCRVFKPGTRGPQAWRAPGFLKLFCPRMLVYVYVCPPPRPLITSHVKGMRNNQIRQFYGPSIFCTTFAVDKLNGRFLSNITRCEHLPKKTKDGY